MAKPITKADAFVPTIRVKTGKIFADFQPKSLVAARKNPNF